MISSDLLNWFVCFCVVKVCPVYKQDDVLLTNQKKIIFFVWVLQFCFFELFYRQLNQLCFEILLENLILKDRYESLNN